MLSSLTPEDLRWCVARLPRAVRKVLQDHPGEVFLAGGYIRSRIARETVQDIDLLTTTRELAALVAASLGGRVHTTANALTLTDHSPAVQVIRRWTFATPEEAIASFDFTIAAAAIWYADGAWKSICHQDYYADLAAKRLRYMSPAREEEPGGSMLRVLKFYKRGYIIPLDSLAAVIARLVGGVRTSWLVEEGEGGLARVITGLLREVDPLIDPTHAAHLPSSAELAHNGGDDDADG